LLTLPTSATCVYVSAQKKLAATYSINLETSYTDQTVMYSSAFNYVAVVYRKGDQNGRHSLHAEVSVHNMHLV